MSEQEIMQRITDCDRQISAAYNDFRSAAREVGAEGCRAARSARQNALAEISGTKMKNTLMPLLLSVLGLFIASVNGFLGFVLFVGGIYLAYKLHQKAGDEQREIQTRYDSMVNVAENQQRNLDTILNNNTKI